MRERKKETKVVANFFKRKMEIGIQRGRRKLEEKKRKAKTRAHLAPQSQAKLRLNLPPNGVGKLDVFAVNILHILIEIPFAALGIKMEGHGDR